MAYPRYIGKSAFASGTGALTVAALTGTQAGDIIVLVCESANQAISPPVGYVDAAAQIGTGTAGAAGAVRIAVFSRVLGEESDTATTVADSGDHTTAIKFLFRDTTLVGQFNASARSSQAATTAMVFPAVTSLIDESMILLAVAQDTDAASTATVGAVTNANLTSITERHDQTVATNTGGGVALITGLKATAGNTGTSTATGSTSVAHAYITLALSPVVNQQSTNAFNSLTDAVYRPLSDAMRIVAGSSGQVDVSASLTFGAVDASGIRSYTCNTKWYYRQYGTDSWSATSAASAVQACWVEDGLITQDGIVLDVRSITGLTNAVEYEFVLFGARDSATPANQLVFTGTASIALPVSAVTGSMAANESGSDTLSASGDVFVKGSLSATESGADALAATGDVFIQGALSATESGADTLASDGDVVVQGSLSAVEAGDDTLSAAGSVTTAGITGSMSATESGDDTLASSGDVFVQGAMTASESGADALSAAGKVIVQGALSATESGADALSATGDVFVIGSMAATETGSDAMSSSGKVIVQGTMSATEAGNDTLFASGSQAATGSMAATEVGDDALVASGAVLVKGALSATESGADAMASTGKVLVRGSLAANESGADTMNAGGGVLVKGALSASESGQDTLASAGVVVVQGALSASEAGSDSFAGAGAVLVKGSMAATESGADSLSAAGTVLVRGSMAATESGSDTMSSAGDVFVRGALAASEAGSDSMASTGKVLVKGALVATESGSDALAAAGIVFSPPITGSMAAQESGQDGLTASGGVYIYDIYIGGEKATRIMLGTIEARKVYLGAKQVFGSVA